MKKIIITMLLSAGVMGAFAQIAETTVSNDMPLTKSGYEILPKKGDFAIGIDATPILDYVGNMFNGTGTLTSGIDDPADILGLPDISLNGKNTAAGAFDGFNGGLYGKYFLENNRAVRASLYINTGKQVYKGTVQDDFAATQPGYNDQTVIDVLNRSVTQVDLTVGYEFRRGYRRLQGFYGPEVGISFASGKDKYTYANPMTAANQTPSSYNFDSEVGPIGETTMGTRTVEQKTGTRLGITLGGFAGVEYFVAPKLSIGGQFGLGLNLYNQKQGEITKETFDAAQGKTVENSTREYKGGEPVSGFSVATAAKGNLFIMFHF